MAKPLQRLLDSSAQWLWPSPVLQLRSNIFIHEHSFVESTTIISEIGLFVNFPIWKGLYPVARIQPLLFPCMFAADAAAMNLIR